MEGGSILMTGVTGHVGFRTLVEALQSGYKVRSAVRSESSIDQIRNAISIQPFVRNDQLTFTIIGDITKDEVFDSALQDMDYAIHIASPLPIPTSDPEADIIQPAIRGTLSILKSALKHVRLKRVVITASSAFVSPPEARMPDYQGVVTPDHRVSPDPVGPYNDPFAAYMASKVLAYNRTLDFIEKEKPHFTLINIMPVFVVGKNELATTLEAVNSGSNQVALNVLLGVQNPAGLRANSVHVDDVAKVHVKSLDPKIEGNQNFACSSDGLRGIIWDDAIDIVKKHFPDAVQQGIFPLGGHQASNKLKYDSTRTEDVLGFKFKNFEEQIINIADWYVKIARLRTEFPYI